MILSGDVPQSALTRADFGIAGAIAFGEDGIAPWFERTQADGSRGVTLRVHLLQAVRNTMDDIRRF